MGEKGLGELQYNQLFVHIALQFLRRNRSNAHISTLLTFGVHMSFLLPPLTVLLQAPTRAVAPSPVLSVIYPLGLIDFFLYMVSDQAIQLAQELWQEMLQMVRLDGVVQSVSSLWSRLQVPTVLRFFWLLRCAAHFAVLLVLAVQAVHDAKRRSIVDAFASGDSALHTLKAHS